MVNANYLRVVSLWAVLLMGLVLCPRVLRAGTIGTFITPLGNMELEFYDDDKPITVSNFVKYVTSGQFTNIFVQRWEPNFVIQAGGYRLTNTTNGLKITSIIPFGNIQNEYSAGHIFSNTYGTIAMARQGGVTNSASSQWFLNLTNNAFLDRVDGGFTVFGHVIAGTNVLNLFIPPPPTNNIELYDLGASGLNTVPAIGNATNLTQLFAGLIYVDIKLRRDVALEVTPTRPGQRSISWKSVAGVTNTLQYSSALAQGAWTIYTNVVGNGGAYSLIDGSADKERVYRVTLTY